MTFSKKIKINEEKKIDDIKLIKNQMFYPNGILKTNYTPKSLLNVNRDVVYKRLLEANDIGIKIEVNVEEESFNLYILNKNNQNFKQNCLLISIVSNWGLESNKY